MKFEEEVKEWDADEDDEPQLGSPAFQFYPGDYLSSSKVMRMSLEAEGAYIRLLAYCWLDGYVPDDMDQLAILCKTSRCRLKKIWPQISACFVEKRSGKLINLRLEKEREKQARHREAKSFAGKKGASARWKPKSTITDLPDD